MIGDIFFEIAKCRLDPMVLPAVIPPGPPLQRWDVLVVQPDGSPATMSLTRKTMLKLLAIRDNPWVFGRIRFLDIEEEIQ